MNIFEKASRLKLRFPSNQNDLNVEQLWDLKLSSANPRASSLDSVARSVNAELKSLTEDSFVEVTPDPLRGQLELKLEILKHIIAFRLEERKKAAQLHEITAERQRLMEILSSKENEELQSLTREQIQDRLNQLDSMASVG